MTSPRLPIRLVAERTGIPWRTLYHYIKTGRLTAERNGFGRYRVILADVQELAAQRSNGTLPAHGQVFTDLQTWIMAIEGEHGEARTATETRAQ